MWGSNGTTSGPCASCGGVHAVDTTESPEQLLASAMSDGQQLGRLLDLYRNYLRMLARVEIGRQLQAKVDASDLVQEVMLEAHRIFRVSAAAAKPSSSPGSGRSSAPFCAGVSADIWAPRNETSAWSGLCVTTSTDLHCSWGAALSIQVARQASRPCAVSKRCCWLTPWRRFRRTIETCLFIDTWKD